MANMKNILILGATSDIAKAVALRYAQAGYGLILASRDTQVLKRDVQDISLRHGVDVETICFDVLDMNSHETFYKNIPKKIDGVVCVVGYLGTQEDAQDNFNETLKIINTNFTGCVSILNIIANDFEKRKQGFIIGISSVAGDRGRGSNYIYGSAKAGFSAYLSGLRNRLCKSKVSVLTVKPGFVATKMTENLNLPAKLTAQPKEVADDIFNAEKKGKNIIYTKWFWRYIMFIIKSIPEIVFKRLGL